VPEAFPTFLAGQRITASLLSSALPITVRKTSDTSRSSTTTATPDPHLQFPNLVANGVYYLTGFIQYSSSTAADILIDWTTPAGAQGNWGGFGAGHSPVISFNTTPAVVGDSQQSRGYTIRLETNIIGQSRSFGGLGTSVILTMNVFAMIRVASVGGTYSMDWAQLASDATNTTIYTDSWLALQRIA
jgi:hypothetical protein